MWEARFCSLQRNIITDAVKIQTKKFKRINDCKISSYCVLFFQGLLYTQTAISSSDQNLHPEPARKFSDIATPWGSPHRLCRSRLRGRASRRLFFCQYSWRKFILKKNIFYSSESCIWKNITFAQLDLKEISSFFHLNVICQPFSSYLKFWFGGFFWATRFWTEIKT